MKSFKKLLASVITFAMVLGMAGVMPAVEAKAASQNITTTGLATEYELMDAATGGNPVTTYADDATQLSIYVTVKAAYADTHTFPETVTITAASDDGAVTNSYDSATGAITIEKTNYPATGGLNIAATSKTKSSQGTFSAVFDPDSHTIVVTAGSNDYILAGAFKNAEATEAKAYNMYELDAQGKAVIDLASYATTKEHIIHIKGSNGTDTATVTIAAAPKKVKIAYDPTSTKGANKGFTFTVDDKEFTSYTSLEYKTANSEWKDWSELTSYMLDAYAVNGTQLIFRIKGTNVTSNVPYSKEGKIKIAKTANAPKITVDFVKMTIKFPKNSQYRMAHSGNFTATPEGWLAATPLSTVFSTAVDVQVPTALYLEVQTKEDTTSTKKKPASKIAIFNAAAQIVANNTGNAILEITPGDGKVTLKPATGVTVEYYHSATATTALPSDGKWTKLTKATDVKESKTKGYIVYRIQGVKAGKDIKAKLASTILCSEKLVFTGGDDDTTTPSATIGDITVAGTVGTAITSSNVVTITLANDTFKSDIAGDVSSWFGSNMPSGLTFTAAAPTDSGAKVAITIAGTSTSKYNGAFAITIPATALTGDSAVTVADNANAKLAVNYADVATATSNGLISSSNTSVTITLTNAKFESNISISDFTFTGTNATAIASGTVTRTSDTIVTISGLTGLTLADNHGVTVAGSAIAEITTGQTATVILAGVN